ncbi:uncharacterized protein BX664DRAFT_265501 [Halteromyces radiatus]|uniref:uncharacterized protein n=1 Tax=Halteromyces radiatus TaxID=101107 RepID=UPI00222106E8|nr:uncharacterized protein BX664DRAFT_265501 [Halteromyces radiatus]KAI8086013.1 hypothetical protein BX664DRAFT_265501 [Halteromyces radiatus]
MATTTTDWTVLEKLLLAQAVNKYGEDNWLQVARTLKQHPLLHDHAKPEIFNQKNCSLQYYLMIDDMESESRRQPKTAGSIVVQDMPKVVKLARQLYFQRVEELKKSIKEDEDKFMALVSEIDDIKSGAWDTKLARLANEQQIPSSITTNTEPTTAINGDQQATPKQKDDQRQKSWQKNVNLLWREIANHKNGAMFMNPIKEAQAPLYYDVVIRTTVEFERDVVLMLTNSLMYNKEGTEIYQMALEMLQDVTEQIKIFKTADGNTSTHTRSASLLAKDTRKSIAE